MDPNWNIKHSNEWSHENFKTAGMPYMYNFVFADIEVFNLNYEYPDVFDKKFEDWADYLARTVCVDMADEPLLLGYADLPVPDFASQRENSWSSELNLDDPKDVEKLQGIVRKYFETTVEAIRRYDKNHMIFGPRFQARDELPEWIPGLAGEFFDILLCNWFVPAADVATDLKQWHEDSGKPVLIADMGFLAPTDILGVKPNGKSCVENQAQRGESYAKFNAQTLTTPFILGHHWCGYIENRTRCSGIKNFLDEPYWDCVKPMQEFNLNHLYETALKAGN